jgi:hypothetical protein
MILLAVQLGLLVWYGTVAVDVITSPKTEEVYTVNNIDDNNTNIVNESNNK